MQSPYSYFKSWGEVLAYAIFPELFWPPNPRSATGGYCCCCFYYYSPAWLLQLATLIWQRQNVFVPAAAPLLLGSLHFLELLQRRGEF